MEDKIYANMATIPNRIAQLEIVVNCILPQVDHLNVYMNGFEEVSRRSRVCNANVPAQWKLVCGTAPSPNR